MTAVDAVTVRIGRLEQRGLLLGLSPAQTGLLGVALLIAVVAEYTSGAPGLFASFPVWGLLSAAALVPIAGRPIAAWMPLLVGWARRTALGQRSYRAKVRQFSRLSLDLPGIPGSLTAWVSPDTKAVLLHDASASTITASLRVSGKGFVLTQDDIQHARVAGWGRLLATLCQQRSVVRLQVLERHTSGGGAEVQRWWAHHAVAQSSWATRVLADLVADAQEHRDKHECLLSVSVRSAGSRKRIGGPPALAALEPQLQMLAEAARRADLVVHGWLTAQDLAGTLRSVFDPHGARDSVGGSAPILVGPVAVEEHWASLVTDSAHHAVYWIQEWPRSEVHAGFLQPLILSPGVHRTLSVTAEPLSAAKAMKDIRRARVEQIADAAQRNRMGQIEDESVRVEAADLARREQEIVAGHGDLKFVGLLTVSAPDPDQLLAACTATEVAAAQALCDIRKLVGQQASAFAAAALPLARRIS